MITTQITGNLTSAPELKQVGESKTVCTLSIASNSMRQGKESPNVLRVEVWGKQAENCAKYLSKGSGVSASGNLEIDVYEKEDGKGVAVKLINATVEFTDRVARQS